jgi:ATP diphosphatase
MTPPASGEPLLEFLAVMRRLRAECPWKREQTHRSLARYLLEETHETLEAIDAGAETGDWEHLREELGDLLLQVVFHARMAEEAGQFAFDDVARAICDKMVRRHPHVFAAEARADGAAAQLVAWEALKRQEREAAGGDGAEHSVLDGVARGLPEWQRAVKLQKRAATVGFDWPHVDDVFLKLHEEIDEVRAEFAALGHAPDASVTRERLEDELGDLLFVAANLTRHGGVDFGGALRRANAKFERRFRRMEAFAREAGTPLESLDLAQQDALWNAVKAEERGEGT